MPGGFGTLDEFFEIVTLIQTQRISRFPVILYGSRYWSGLIKWLKSDVEKSGYISRGDLELCTITDKTDDAINLILDYLRRVGPPKACLAPSPSRATDRFRSN